MAKSTGNEAVLSPGLKTTALGTTAVPESVLPVGGEMILFVPAFHVFAIAGPAVQTNASMATASLSRAADRLPRAPPSLRYGCVIYPP
jgi:hypothetical protein